MRKALAAVLALSVIASAQGSKRRDIHVLTDIESKKVIELKTAQNSAYKAWEAARMTQNKFEDSLRIKYHTDKHTGLMGESFGSSQCVSNGSVTGTAKGNEMGMDCTAPAEITEDGKYLVDEYFDYRKEKP